MVSTNTNGENFININVNIPDFLKDTEINVGKHGMFVVGGSALTPLLWKTGLYGGPKYLTVHLQKNTKQEF